MMRQPASLERTALRLLLLLAVLTLSLVLLGLVNFHLATLHVRVAGGSMAETLFGPHFLIECHDCRIEYRCGLEYTPLDGERTVCPNCGARNQPTRSQLRGGQRLSVQRLEGRPPRRWDLVVYRTATTPHELAVKRVVGLPGEHVSLVRGDLYINGRSEPKTIEQIRQVAIPLYDSRYRSRLELDFPRWDGPARNSGWQRTAEGWQYVARRPPDSPADPEPIDDWLVYTQWPCFSNPAPPLRRTEASPVRDYYGYNQQLQRGPLNVVTDLLLVVDLNQQDASQLLLRIGENRQAAVAILDLRDQTATLQRGISRWQGPLPVPRQASWQVEMAVVDGQVLLAVNRRVVGRLRDATRPLFTSRDPRPAAIAVRGGSLTVHRLQMFRDLYYFGPDPTAARWDLAEPLGPHQYLLLGDNVPVSIDSRFWRPAGLSGDQMIGRVILEE